MEIPWIEEIICGDFSKEILIGYFKTRGVNIEGYKSFQEIEALMIDFFWVSIYTLYVIVDEHGKLRQLLYHNLKNCWALKRILEDAK